MKFLYIVFISLILSACATSYVSPDTEKLTDAQVAYIKVKNSGMANSRWSSVIHSVFGMSGEVAPTAGAASYKSLRLLPGKYTVYLACKFGTLMSRSDVPINVNVHAGYTYVIDCQFAGRNKVRAYLNGSFQTGKAPNGQQMHKNETQEQQKLDELKDLLSPGQQLI